VQDPCEALLSIFSMEFMFWVTCGNIGELPFLT